MLSFLPLYEFPLLSFPFDEMLGGLFLNLSSWVTTDPSPFQDFHAIGTIVILPSVEAAFSPEEIAFAQSPLSS